MGENVGNGQQEADHIWDESNAEAMLQLRAQVITDRWDERIAAMRRLELKHGRKDWRRKPQPMSKKAEPEPKAVK